MRFYRLLHLMLIMILLSLSSLAKASDYGVGAGTESKADTAVRSQGLISKIVRYFSEANIPKENDRFDISFIGGPYYTSDIGLGIGVVASGQYGPSIIDSVRNSHIRSEAGLFMNVSTTGFVKVGMEGVHQMPSEKFRVIYDLSFENFPKKFWGIGYENGRRSGHYSKFDEISVKLHARMEFALGHSLYLGPSIDGGWVNANKVHNPEIWGDNKRHLATVGVGATMSYDTRDNLTGPHGGLYATLESRLYPSFLGNGTHHFFILEGSVSHYHQVWKSGVLAMRYHTALSWGNTPWCLLPTFGGSRTMRGYYDGRYRDKNEMDATVELRQNIWHRCGVVIWCGAATVFDRVSHLSLKKVLPNAGFGYRWEFKKNSNVRIDFGIGRGETAFVFNINEAF